MAEESNCCRISLSNNLPAQKHGSLEKEQDGGYGSVTRWEGHRAGVWHVVCF